MKLCCNNFQKLVLKKYTQNKRSWRLLYNKINWVLGGRMMPWSLLVFWIPHGTAFFWLCYWLVPGPSLHYSFFPPACFLTFLFLSVVFSFSSLWDSFTTHLCNSNQQPVKILWTGTATKEYVNNFSKFVFWVCHIFFETPWVNLWYSLCSWKSGK